MTQIRRNRAVIFRALLPTLVAFMITVSCGTKWALPTATNSDSTFSAGVANYIRISPDWSSNNGFSFQTPRDIISGRDGYLFVANQTGRSITVLDASGTVITSDAFGNDFSALASLPFEPYAIAQDSRLNLFIADSSNVIWVWNQFINNVGIQAIITSVQFRHIGWVSNLDSIATLLTTASIDTFQVTTEGIVNLMGIHPFWDGNNPVDSTNAARYYIGADTIRFTGVSNGPADQDFAYAADAASNSLVRFTYKPTAFVLTNNNQMTFLYRGVISQRPASRGSGNGTVNTPKGVCTDLEGGIYYTQWGPIFGLHKIGGNGAFDLGEEPIMDLNRFDHPSDVTVDQTGSIYVADTDNNQIQQFDRQGNFTYYVGVSKARVDTTLIYSTLSDTGWVYTSVDTVIDKFSADILNRPLGVTVDASNVVYIADTGNNRVMRFKLSTDFNYQQPQQ